ncbi:MAG: hypothetical protein ABSG04_13700 [Verrucomicrobiota bacterium]
MEPNGGPQLIQTKRGLGLALSREFAALLGFALTACFTGEKALTLSLKRSP